MNLYPLERQKKIEKLLEEINVPEEKLDHALVQIALKFAIEYEIKNEDLHLIVK